MRASLERLLAVVTSGLTHAGEHRDKAAAVAEEWTQRLSSAKKVCLRV